MSISGVAIVMSVINDLLRDASTAVRGFRRDIGLVLGIVLILGLAIGLNTAVLTAVDAVLMRPLAYDHPEELVRIRMSWDRNADEDLLMPGGYLSELRSRRDAFAGVAAAALTERMSLAGDGVPEAVRIRLGTPGIFRLLGVRPHLGRVFASDEPPRSVLVTYDAWRARFGSDPDVIGRRLTLNGSAHKVVGVLPEGFALHLTSRSMEPELWISPDMAPGTYWTSVADNQNALHYVARLAPGATVEVARAAVAPLAADIRTRSAAAERLGIDLTVDPLRDRVVTGARGFMLTLAIGVLFVLLVACANVANLLLVRAEGRGRQIVIRKALGASNTRIVRQLLADGLLLSLLGGALGVVVATGALGLIRDLAPVQVPRLDAVGVDPRFILVATGLAVVSAMLGALAPALFVARQTSPASALSGSRTIGRRGMRRTHALLGGTQVTLALVLVIGSTLFARTLTELGRVDPGFDPSGAVTFSLAPPSPRYEDGESAGEFLERVEERLRAVPGVTAVGVGWPLPLIGGAYAPVFGAEGDAEPMSRNGWFTLLTPGAYHALGLELEEGRLFTAADAGTTVVVSRALAEELWPGESALGRVLLTHPWGEENERFEVAGVVSDVRHASLREPLTPAVYFPVRAWAWAGWDFHFVVRGPANPVALVPALRSAVAEVDATVPIADVATYDQVIERGLAAERFSLALVGVFAVSALVLALLGLYGIIAYQATRRRKEFGIRLAVGARRQAISGLVLADTARFTIPGLGAGVVLMASGSRYLASQLFGIGATDLPTYVLGVAGLGVVAVLASLIPMLRVNRLDPTEVLREE